MSEFVIEMKGVTKIFPGTKALDNVDLSIKQGEIHALLGENGAGKKYVNELSGRTIHYGRRRDFDGWTAS